MSDYCAHPEMQVHRAPSASCLLCVSCRRSVTPCLVCGHLLPCCLCSFRLPWIECRKCRLKNPLGDEERRMLGFSSALALPSAMVRRLLIAYLGRPLSVAAVGSYCKSIEQALGAIQSVEDNARIKALVNGEDSCKMIDPWPPNTCLPFLLTDGLIVQLLDPLQKQIIENEAGNHVLPEAAEDGSVSCVDCGRTCNCSREFGNGVADEDLRRYQEQLTALDCADAVSRDIDSSAYPVCNTVIKPSLNNHKKSACNLRTRHDCLSGMAKGLSINMLRLVTSAFINGFERWLLQKEGPSLKVFKLEEMFTCVEAFKLKQDQLIYLQVKLEKGIIEDFVGAF
ncbi:hypothetical protein KP509_09G006600 [Ceratopteris richardii]|uniref:Uncharacterized protein n=1 Tax=Ceratopteris richardii TaxID=49495 RepID=A0A8T2TZX6_CERRI|nr:hypothetical protein KP509_09G006600 [Ceratopteris richardii]